MPIEHINKTDTLNEGREKLNAAIDGANAADVTSQEADTKATQALSNSESTQTQLDTIVIDGDSSVEAAQARVDEKGDPHPTLKARIDDGMNSVNQQLAQKSNYRQQQAGDSSQNINMISGYIGNDISNKLHSASISGGGSVGRENVIGGITDNVGTSVSNVDTTDSNTVAHYSHIGGGYDNVANGLASAITGFHCKIEKETTHGTISGGSFHEINAGDYSTVGGGTTNIVEGGIANTIAGGQFNTIASNTNFKNIGGGRNNIATASGSAISGGDGNKTLGNNSYIGAGSSNTTNGTNSVISGGTENEANEQSTVVSGGFSNKANGSTSTIIGGSSNVTTGAFSSVLGGLGNKAEGSYSIASGSYSKTSSHGQQSHAYGKFEEDGDAQNSKYALKNTTTNGSLTPIGLNGASAPQFPVNLAFSFKYTVIAKTVGSNEAKSWIVEGMAINGDGSNLSIIGTPEIKTIGEGAGTSAWLVEVSAGSNSLTLSGRAETGKTVQWVAKLETVEVIG